MVAWPGMTSPNGRGMGEVLTTDSRWPTMRRTLPEVSPTADLHEHDVPAGRLLNRDAELPAGAHWERMLATFERLQNGQAALAEQLWAAISSNILEWAYSPSATILSSSDVATGGSYPTLSAQTSELEYITSIVACVPTSQTGIIQLGSVNIPIGVGVTVMAPVNFPLFMADIRSLTVTGAGPCGLYLMGRVAPTRGKLPL